jgi:hypothetical protein
VQSAQGRLKNDTGKENTGKETPARPGQKTSARQKRKLGRRSPNPDWSGGDEDGIDKSDNEPVARYKRPGQNIPESSSPGQDDDDFSDFSEIDDQPQPPPIEFPDPYGNPNKKHRPKSGGNPSKNPKPRSDRNPSKKKPRHSSDEDDDDDDFQSPLFKAFPRLVQMKKEANKNLLAEREEDEKWRRSLKLRDHHKY